MAWDRTNPDCTSWADERAGVGFLVQREGGAWVARWGWLESTGFRQLPREDTLAATLARCERLADRIVMAREYANGARVLVEHGGPWAAAWWAREAGRALVELGGLIDGA